MYSVFNLEHINPNDKKTNKLLFEIDGNILSVEIEDIHKFVQSPITGINISVGTKDMNQFTKKLMVDILQDFKSNFKPAIAKIYQ